MTLDVACVLADDFYFVIIANILAVGHAMVEGAWYAVLVEVAGEASFWDFAQFGEAGALALGGAMLGVDDVAEVVV